MQDYQNWYTTQNNQLHDAFDSLVKYINEMYREKKKIIKKEYLQTSQKVFDNKDKLTIHLNSLSQNIHKYTD